MKRIDIERVAAELVALLAEADRREAKLREHTKDEKEAIAAIRGQALERRDIIAGKQGVQLSIGHTRGEADAVEALEEARKVARCADCGEPDNRPGGALTADEGLCWGCYCKRHPEVGADLLPATTKKPKKTKKEPPPSCWVCGTTVGPFAALRSSAGHAFCEPCCEALIKDHGPAGLEPCGACGDPAALYSAGCEECWHDVAASDLIRTAEEAHAAKGSEATP
jgi:hypothetical protein